MIYHLALREDWQAAQAAGVYSVSTRGKTLQEVGFIHASYDGQVQAVATAFYRDAGDLVLLEIDPERLTSELRPEPVGKETFPHIYGPLNLDAVVAARPFSFD